MEYEYKNKDIIRDFHGISLLNVNAKKGAWKRYQ